jgi:hypothetical protein
MGSASHGDGESRQRGDGCWRLSGSADDRYGELDEGQQNFLPRHLRLAPVAGSRVLAFGLCLSAVVVWRRVIERLRAGNVWRALGYSAGLRI